MTLDVPGRRKYKLRAGEESELAEVLPGAGLGGLLLIAGVGLGWVKRRGRAAASEVEGQ